MIINKEAYRNYQIKEELEVGIVLTGSEVKSIINSRVVLKDSFVKPLNDDLVLINANIARYQFDGSDKYDPIRTRKLLLHRKEIDNLRSKSKQWGMTLIPLKMYIKNGKVKLLIGLGRGRKKFEIKNLDKERDLDMELHREKREYMVK